MAETNRPVTRPRRPARSLLFPLLLVALGVVFLLNNLGVLGATAWDQLLRLWPVLLILWGLDDLLRREGAAGPALMIGLGAILLLNNFGVINVGVWGLLIALWPLLLVAWGFDLIVGRRSLWLGLLGAALMLVILAGALVLYGAFTPVAAVQGDTVRHDLGAATSAQVSLDPAVGELNLDALASGGEELIAGRLETPPGTEVLEDVSQDGDQTVVALSTKGRVPSFTGQVGRWEWNLGVNPDVPVDLNVDMGAGRLNLDLRNLMVNDLVVDMGVGETVVYLPEQGATQAQVNSAIGQLQVILPEGAEVRVQVDRAITGMSLPPELEAVSEDTYQTAGYEQAEQRIDLEVSQAIGNISVQYP